MTSNLAGKHVLIVDDEAELRRAMMFDFKRRKCIVYEAANGQQALQIVKTQTVDIVVSDVRMPDGDGIKLLQEIRLIHPEIPIVLLATGFADLSEEQAMGMGAHALVEKPIDRKRLFSILDDASKVK
ncbi:MAG: response regulator [Bdellovibrionales bacterium]